MSNIKKAGVVGWPVSHSLSPRLHGYWLRRYDIAGSYKGYAVEPKNLSEFIGGLRKDKDFCGVNLTLPHKEMVMELLDEVDEKAQKIGAVNTVINNNGKLRGTNTDAYGFAENIRPFIAGKKKAVVLGAGGAARAVCFALAELGFAQVVITNRTRERAEHLAELYSNASVADWQDNSAVLENADLLVNTTSLGMVEKELLDIDLSLLPQVALVTDIVYNPLVTNLLEKAQGRGNTVIDGLGMLLYQAVPAFEAWFGVKPEVTDELREFVLSGK